MIGIECWKNYKLGDCVNFVSGGTPSKKNPEYWDGNIPWVSCKDMKKAYLYDSQDHITEKGAANGTRFVSPETIIIVVRGMILGQHFPVAIAKRKMAFNQDLKALECAPNVHPKFLFHWLRGKSYEILGIVDEAAHGTKRLQTDRLQNFPLHLPPLPIQRKIAGILSAYDDLIENNTRRIEILEEMARSIYREWFVNFRFPGHEQVQMVDSELGLIPKGWEVVKVEDIYRTSSGGTPSRKNPDFYGGSILWIKTRELNDGFIFDTEEKITDLGLQKSSAKLFPPDTVIMAMYGATIGMLGIFTSPAATNQACCAILNNNSLFSSYYAFLYLLENREKIFSLGMGAAQQNISQQVIKALEILKPSNEVMRKFNDLAEPLFKTIKVLQHKNINLRQTRDLLLPRLISGEIDVENLDINTDQIAA